MRDEWSTTPLPRRPIVWAAAAVAVVVVAGAALLLFSGTDDQASTPGNDTHSHLAPLGAQTADQAASAALETMYSFDPAHDPDSGAGMRRAARWLTGPLRAAALTPASSQTSIRQSTQWETWKTNKDIVSALVDVDDRVDDAHTPTAVDVKVTVRQVVQHTDGSSDPLSVQHMTAHCAQVDGRWLVADLTDVSTIPLDGADAATVPA